MHDYNGFQIRVGDFWKKDNKVYHIPRDEKQLFKDKKFEIIVCEQNKRGLWLWKFPRSIEEDELIVSLSWFQDAEWIGKLE